MSRAAAILAFLPPEDRLREGDPILVDGQPATFVRIERDDVHGAVLDYRSADGFSRWMSLTAAATRMTRVAA